jgi:N-acetylglucosaminyldiphosphoundecaprenol N-acetyl-beta-D-mannosaminyltransferase
VNVLGVRISPLTLRALLEVIERTALTSGRATILTANARALNLAYEQPRLRRFFNQSDYVVCDGFGVLWAARWLGQPLPERMTPPDWLPDVAALCARHGFSVFFLGNRPGVAERAAGRLRAAYPGLHVAGTQHGYFDRTPGSAENERVLERINAARPQLLYVGFGMPSQEYWLEANWPRLDVKVAITAGAMLDFVAGVTPRGPRWMTDRGLEWLTRLATEPRRLWARYVLGLPVFASRVIRQRLGLLRMPEASLAERSV